MKFFDVGDNASGVIAIGSQATGVIALGQVATGFFAVGQIARGVIAVGQGAIGIVAIGQGAVGVLYGMGMLGVGARSVGMISIGVRGSGLLVLDLLPAMARTFSGRAVPTPAMLDTLLERRVEASWVRVHLVADGNGLAFVRNGARLPIEIRVGANVQRFERDVLAHVSWQSQPVAADAAVVDYREAPPTRPVLVCQQIVDLPPPMPLRWVRGLMALALMAGLVTIVWYFALADVLTWVTTAD